MRLGKEVKATMSKGIGGYMNLRAADDKMLVYSYCCYNVNNNDWQEMQKKEDGEIIIARESYDGL